MVVLPRILLGSLWKRFVQLRGERTQIYQIPVADDRNYLAPNRHLLELYVRARNIDEARSMRDVFKARYHYPSYFEPQVMGFLGWQVFLVAPRIHDVVWRELRTNDEYFFFSARLSDLCK